MFLEMLKELNVVGLEGGKLLNKVKVMPLVGVSAASRAHLLLLLLLTSNVSMH